MITQLITKAASEYFRIKEQILMTIMPLNCNCTNPGYNLKCKDCPFYMDVVYKVQSILYEKPSKECIAAKPNKYAHNTGIPAYSEETVQKCLELYSKVKSIREVAKTFAITEGTILRWLKKAGMYKNIYSLETKKKCIELCNETNLQNAAQEYDIKPATIVKWLKQLEEGKLDDGQNGYSKEFKKEALKLYQEVKNAKEVSRILTLASGTLYRWIKESNIEVYEKSNVKMYGKEDAIYKHPQETVDKCLELYAQVNNANEVSRQMGVSPSTIKKWINQTKN